LRLDDVKPEAGFHTGPGNHNSTLTFLLLPVDKSSMSFIADLLVERQIQDVLVDSEVTYIMLTNGTQITIRGLVIVEPCEANSKVSTLERIAS
jgi:hypothetical protein